MISDRGQACRQNCGVRHNVVVAQRYQTCAALECAAADPCDVRRHVNRFQIFHVGKRIAADVVDVPVLLRILVTQDDPVDQAADTARQDDIVVHVTVTGDCENAVVGKEAEDVVAVTDRSERAHVTRRDLVVIGERLGCRFRFGRDGFGHDRRAGLDGVRVVIKISVFIPAEMQRDVLG